MKASISFKWYAGAKKKLLNAPDLVIYTCANKTLSFATPIIPMNTGKMRKTSIGAGVRGGNGDYYVGSYTSYAKKVWNMNSSTTNWSEPGTTSKWYEIALKKHGKIILQQALKERKLK